MSSPRITLQTVTGVDVELTLAGPGARSYAFVIDWHIRIMLLLGWVGLAQFFYTGGSFRLEDDPDRRYFLFVWLPGLVLYLLYHPILEIAMRGRTPGKRIARVRLVTREGDIPGAGALLLRNVFRLLDSMPVLYLVGLATVIITDQHVRIGDLAAGTLLVLDDDGGAGSFATAAAPPGGMTPEAADLVHELLERWPALEERNRASIGRALLARLEPQMTPEQLAALSTPDLRSRLMTKLGAR